VTEDELRQLLYRRESETLDFKRDQYAFTKATDDQKAELLKDVMSFANALMREQLLTVTRDALRRPCERRFYATERGYQGHLYCALQSLLIQQGIVDGRTILELEYQKSGRHGTSQRPDIILHVPTEHSGSSVEDSNFAVWALKRAVDRGAALEDFDKLDEMFARLRYGIGIFVNIDADDHFIEEYRGGFSDRLVGVALRRGSGEVRLIESGGWPGTAT
jgi:hypothetical protein